MSSYSLSNRLKIKSYSLSTGPRRDELAAGCEINLVEIPGVIIQNHTPATISPVFLDKLDTYRRRYKSGAAGAARNIVGIARVRKGVDADVLP